MVKASPIIKHHASKEIRKWWNVEVNVTCLFPSVLIIYRTLSFVWSLENIKACMSQTHGKKQGQQNGCQNEDFCHEITFTAVFG